MDFTELSLLKKQLSTLMKKYKVEAEGVVAEGIDTLFAKYPKLEEVSLSVSNHEFNDGDATRFYINYEEPDINGADDEDDEDLGGLTAEEFVAIRKKVVAIFKSVEPVLETLYGDEYDSIVFER